MEEEEEEEEEKRRRTRRYHGRLVSNFALVSRPRVAQQFRTSFLHCLVFRVFVPYFMVTKLRLVKNLIFNVPLHAYWIPGDR